MSRLTYVSKDHQAIPIQALGPVLGPEDNITKRYCKELQNRPLAWSDLPTTCPSVFCSHPLPATPVPRVLTRFQCAHDLEKTGGPQAKGLAFTQLEICSAITFERPRSVVVALGKRRNWPATIDWGDVGTRIFTENEEEHDLETLLFNTIYSIIDKSPGRYGDDYYDDSDDSKYLRINDFITFVLVPFVAVTLIVEDYALRLDFQDALFERQSTGPEKSQKFRSLDVAEHDEDLGGTPMLRTA
ncbi:hypothetical protein B0H14DRAFT_2613202 [Mycena olivaceomarginata]|nr:hypothetical protein B0H14DRAFT_2613202 [Mycena olivaceomarginata]